MDFERRERWLTEIDERGEAGIPEWIANWPDGRLKMFVTARALRTRRALPEVFVGGDYVPLKCELMTRGDVVAFARTAGNDVVIVAAPRLGARLDCAGLPLGAECWKTSRLMLPEPLRGRTFRNVLTGAEIKPTLRGDEGWFFVGQLFTQLPVALLQSV